MSTKFKSQHYSARRVDLLFDSAVSHGQLMVSKGLEGLEP
jgi:hypothetical protein